MKKALYMVDSEALDAAYAPKVRDEIARRVQVIAPLRQSSPSHITPEELRDVQILFAGPGMVRLDERFLQKAPRLEAVFFANVRADQFVTDVALEHGISIFTAEAQHAEDEARAIAAQIHFAVAQRGEGREATVGLLSFAALARAVRDQLRSAPVRILVADPDLAPEAAAQQGVELCSVEEVFQRSDVIACASPWLEKSGRLIGTQHLSLLQPGATLITAGGGTLVDETALIQVLRERRDLTVTVAAALEENVRAAGAWVIEELDREVAGIALTEAEPATDFSPQSHPLPSTQSPPPLAPHSREVAPPGAKMSASASAGPLPWWKRSSFLVVSVVLHLLFGAGATYFVVAKYAAPRKLTFQAGPPSPNPSKRAIEHKVQMAKKLNTASAPPMTRRILTAGLAKVTLPPIPEMSAPATSSPSRLPGMGGAGFASAGAQAAAGGTMTAGSGPPISFFGIKDTAKSVVVMIDVSHSMFTRTGDADGRKLLKSGSEQSFQTIREEAIKLIESLPPHTRFGLVRWSGGAYPWKPELVPASTENKAAAVAHIQSEVDMNSAGPRKDRPGGTRHDYALEAAFALKPEIIYMLTDGNATAAQPGGGVKPIEPDEIWKAAEAGQETLGKKARLHAIYYVTGADKEDERRMLRTLASRNGGKFREVEAKGRKK